MNLHSINMWICIKQDHIYLDQNNVCIRPVALHILRYVPVAWSCSDLPSHMPFVILLCFLRTTSYCIYVFKVKTLWLEIRPEKHLKVFLLLFLRWKNEYSNIIRVETWTHTHKEKITLPTSALEFTNVIFVKLYHRTSKVRVSSHLSLSFCYLALNLYLGDI